MCRPHSTGQGAGSGSVSEMKSSKRRVQTQRCVSDNQPSIMDILTKKKAAPKAPRAAPREESPPSEATAAVAKKPGPPRGRKATKRLTSSSDSDSDFGSRPSKSVAAKVCRLPHVCAEGAPGCRVLFWWKRGGSRSSSQ